MLKINVPYSEKEIAKQLGAIWSFTDSTWYIPRKKYDCIKDFEKWIDMKGTQNTLILHAPIFIVQTTRKCWKCGNIIEIVGIANKRTNKVEFPFEKIDKDTDDEDKDELSNYVSKDDFYYRTFGFQLRFISYVRNLSQYNLTKIKQVSPYYELGYSKIAKHKYYANICPHCKMLQGDFELYEELDEGFLIAFEEKDVKLHLLENSYDLLIQGEANDVIIL